MGKTLGIIGMGRIGQSLATKVAVFGMNVIYHNRHRLDPQTERRCAARYVSLEELLRSSDYVSLHLPYTPESHHIINDSTLSMMKDGAIFINTARGACVKESDLANHLASGHLRGAALDVYEFEPKITPALLSLDNVVLSPHIGTGTIECRIATGRCVADNINAFIREDFKEMNLVNEIKQ
jgi:lactate dehydrogenase-like 2-hydroxyacid dehydrogenase